MERDWRDLIYLSQVIDGKNRDQLTLLMNGAGGDGSRISWLGFADLDGQVVAATNDLLVGQSVGERPWYRNGLVGGFAGDVHDAVLLSQLLNPNGSEPLRFIDLAIPVTDASGAIIGVLGMHINQNWLTDYLRENAELFGLDLYLINPDGGVSASSSEVVPTLEDLQILRSSQTGAQLSAKEVWPDGQEYFATLVSNVTYGDLPNFGWRLIGKIDVNQVDFKGDYVVRGVVIVSTLVVVMVLLAAAVFNAVFVSPITSLAQSARDIADGSKDHPANSRSTREAAQFSSALSDLQADRINDY